MQPGRGATTKQLRESPRPSALKVRFNDPTSGLGNATGDLLVDGISLQVTELIVAGCHPASDGRHCLYAEETQAR